MKIIAQGAEAKIILSNGFIIKDRISKSYRIKEIDDKIRKQRTKAEKKLLEKASKIINAPDPFPLEEFNKIKMPFVEGKKLSEHLDSFPLNKQKEICKTIGQEIAKLHDAEIIHGDLTTSNMILTSKICEDKREKNKNPIVEQKGKVKKRGDNNFQIFLIDFGLGYFSRKAEDKAVDLHLLKQALEAKHFKNWKELFGEVEKGYKDSKESAKVLERLKAVEKRGRYKEH